MYSKPMMSVSLLSLLVLVATLSGPSEPETPRHTTTQTASTSTTSYTTSELATKPLPATTLSGEFNVNQLQGEVKSFNEFSAKCKRMVIH